MDYNTILYFYLYFLLKCKGRIVMSYIVDIISQYGSQYYIIFNCGLPTEFL